MIQLESDAMAGASPYLSYLRALASWDQRFPGFEHDTHGLENRDGLYHVQCVVKSHVGDLEAGFERTLSQDIVTV